MSLAQKLARVGSFAVIVAMVFFLYAGTTARAATTHDVKVGGETTSNVTSGVVWYNGYDPGTIVIAVGDTIRWTVAGGVHTVTSTIRLPNGNFEYDSSPLFTPEAALADIAPGAGLLLAPGSTYDLDTLTLAVGTYGYFCKIHPGMAGTLIVTASAPSPAIVNAVAGFGDSVFAQQAFSPATLTVGRGTIVRWTLLNPTEPHTITGENGAWDSSPNFNPPGPPPVLLPTQQFQWTFNTPGTFTYMCKVHAYLVGESWSGMVGTVVVEVQTEANEALATANNAVAVANNATTLSYIGLGLGGLAVALALVAIIRRWT